MTNLIKYTNGTGHLIMSIVGTAAGIALILVPGLDATTKGVGVALISTVQGYWFVSGSAKQVASEVVSQMGQTGPNAAPSVMTVTQPAPIVTVTQPIPVPPAPPAGPSQ
jgi:hypothetical protein